MAGVAFVHVQPDRGAQFAFGSVPAAEVEGARAIALGVASLIRRREEELFAIGFVRFDPQRCFGSAEKHRSDLAVDFLGGFVPGCLQGILRFVDLRATFTSLRNRLLASFADPRDFRQAEIVNLLRGKRQSGHFGDAIIIKGVAARHGRKTNRIACLGKIGICQISPQPTDCRIERLIDRRCQICTSLLFLTIGETVRQCPQRRIIGILFGGRRKLCVELFNHHLDRQSRQGDALFQPVIEPRDDVFHHLPVSLVASDIGGVIARRLERHHTIGGGKSRIIALNAGEVIQRQRQADFQDFRLQPGERTLTGITERVVGDLVLCAQRGSIDRCQFGQLCFGCYAVSRKACRRKIAELVRIRKIAPVKCGYGRSVECSSFASGEKIAQLLSFAVLSGWSRARLGKRSRSRHRSNSDGKRGSGS